MKRAALSGTLAAVCLAWVVGCGGSAETSDQGSGGAGASSGGAASSSGGSTASGGAAASSGGSSSSAPSGGAGGAAGSGGGANGGGSAAAGGGTATSGLCAPGATCGGINVCYEDCFSADCCSLTCWCDSDDTLECNMDCT